MTTGLLVDDSVEENGDFGTARRNLKRLKTSRAPPVNPFPMCKSVFKCSEVTPHSKNRVNAT